MSFQHVGKLRAALQCGCVFFIGGRLPVVSYWLVNFLVSILLASTSGWLKALMPMMEPATAVAISQRKNSWPRVYVFGSVMRTTGCPAFSSAATAESCALLGFDARRR